MQGRQPTAQCIAVLTHAGRRQLNAGRRQLNATRRQLNAGRRLLLGGGCHGTCAASWSRPHGESLELPDVKSLMAVFERWTLRGVLVKLTILLSFQSGFNHD